MSLSLFLSFLSDLLFLLFLKDFTYYDFYWPTKTILLGFISFFAHFMFYYFLCGFLSIWSLLWQTTLPYEKQHRQPQTPLATWMRLDNEGFFDERDKCYFTNMVFLYPVNHSTITVFFNESLLQLWPDQILYHNILFATTDAAPYMMKGKWALKMMHITCIAHGLHRDTELIRHNYSVVNRLINAGKTVFVKTPLREFGNLKIHTLEFFYLHYL